MSFNSLNHVLGGLEAQYKTSEHRKFQRLVASWKEIVGEAIAAQTQVVSIQRGTLFVATSSACWSQNLVFERQRLLEKLNEKLSYSLTDIRFSTAQWKHNPENSEKPVEEQVQLWINHPSRITEQKDHQNTNRLKNSNPPDPLSAFQKWSHLIQSRLNHLPQCPQCQAPVPIGELERWQMCALCIAKKW